MINQSSYFYATLLLFIVPLLVAGIKFNDKATSLDDLLPKEAFKVSFEFDISNLPEKSFVKIYLPKSNQRQSIRHISLRGDSLDFKLEEYQSDQKGLWETNNQSDAVFNYEFEVEGKSLLYTLPEQAQFESFFEDSLLQYLHSTKNIQSDHPLIDSLAKTLKTENLKTSIKANFDFVQHITNSETGVLTDALTALKRNRASCNGKSRLFVALCRAQGIPSRVVGGIILENARKRTSHLWAEIYYQGHWIPFDVLNNHFAALPANYLELYKGDNFLITHSKNIGFDYRFIIQRKFQTMGSVSSVGPQLWSLLNTLGIPLNLLRGILLLPLAALIIAIFRNVIGLKTFGIFLPALISLALVNVDFTLGVVIFGALIFLISILHFVLEKWGLLHIPKVVIMLTCVILTLFGFSLLSLQSEWEILKFTMFLPVVVLSIIAERFAKTLVEESFTDALKMLGSTAVITLLCYPVFQSDLLVGFFLSYPEFYLSILSIMLLLGRWIGMRVLEYKRFATFAKA